MKVAIGLSWWGNWIQNTIKQIFVFSHFYCISMFTDIVRDSGLSPQFLTYHVDVLWEGPSISSIASGPIPFSFVWIKYGKTEEEEKQQITHFNDSNVLIVWWRPHTWSLSFLLHIYNFGLNFSPHKCALIATKQIHDNM